MVVAFPLFGLFLWLRPLALFPAGFAIFDLIVCLYLFLIVLFVYLFVELVDPIVK